MGGVFGPALSILLGSRPPMHGAAPYPLGVPSLARARPIPGGRTKFPPQKTLGLHEPQAAFCWLVFRLAQGPRIAQPVLKFLPAFTLSRRSPHHCIEEIRAAQSVVQDAQAASLLRNVFSVTK